MTLEKYSFKIKTEVNFGAGAREQAAEEAKRLGMTKVMLVADKGVIGVGLADPIEESLKKANLPYVIYDKIVPNPRDVHCMEGAEFCRENGCDGLITIGGGSSMDSAKCIAALVTNGGKVRDYCGVNLLKNDALPIIACPTTAGTGAEMTWDAVITDTTTKEKLNILDMKIAPDVALVDPTVLLGLPSHIMAACGVDAMVHAVESFTVNVANPHTDALGLRAMELIQKNLRGAVSEPNIENCTAMMLASNLAGAAFGYSDVGAVHCIAEALGGRYDIPHGVANAILFPTVIEYNVPADIEKHARIAEALGIDTRGMSEEEAAYSCVGALDQLCRDVNISKMKDIPEIKPEEFPLIAEASSLNASNDSNCRPCTKDDYMMLLKKAYEA